MPGPAHHLIFLLGGARSGKSTYAETWASEHGRHVLYVATAQAFDDEMRERIAHHRASRPTTWTTLEAPLKTGDSIRAALDGHDTVLLDCLTVLSANVLLTLPDETSQDQATAAILDEVEALLAAYVLSDATWLIVSNEVGMGVVPPTRLGRFFRDALGRANQRVAQTADEVVLLVAGLPWRLKERTMSPIKHIPTPYTYSSAVVAGDYVFLGLHRGFGASFSDQLEDTFEGLKKTLAELGLSLEHIVKVNVWLKNIQDLPEMERLFNTYFEKDHFPARMTSTTEFIDADCLLMIDGVAYTRS